MNSLMSLRDLTEKTQVDTSLEARMFVLRQHGFSIQKKELTMRKVETCARKETVFRVLLDAGECEVTSVLIQPRDLEDVCQSTFQDQLLQEMIRSLWSLERHDISWLLIIKRTHLKKLKTSCPSS